MLVRDTPKNNSRSFDSAEVRFAQDDRSSFDKGLWGTPGIREAVCVREQDWYTDCAGLSCFPSRILRVFLRIE